MKRSKQSRKRSAATETQRGCVEFAGLTGLNFLSFIQDVGCVQSTPLPCWWTVEAEYIQDVA